MYTLEDLKEAFLSGYYSGRANGYACSSEDEFNDYLKELEWEQRQKEKLKESENNR